MARNALGTGLGALIPGPRFPNLRDDYFLCPVEEIDFDPTQPRQAFDEQALAELEQSVREKGILQPLLVRSDGARYLLVAGERRLRAAKRVGLAEVPVLVKDVATEEAFELALIENIQREDLNAIEEAAAYERLLSARSYTQDALAKRIGKNRVTIANSVRLLKLETDLQQLVIDGQLTAGHARSLLSVSNGLHRKDLAQRIVTDGLSVRAAEAAVAELKASSSPDKPAPQPKRRKATPLQPYFDTVAAELSEALGSTVAVTAKGRKGRVTIEFRSVEDLRALRDRIVGAAESPFSTATPAEA